MDPTLKILIFAVIFGAIGVIRGLKAADKEAAQAQRDRDDFLAEHEAFMGELAQLEAEHERRSQEWEAKTK